MTMPAYTVQYNEYVDYLLKSSSTYVEILFEMVWIF